MFKLLYHCGRYFVFLGKVVSMPEKGSVFRRRVMEEVDKIGISSLPIVVIMSVFMGGVIAIQMAASLATGSIIPKETVGFATRESMILEFSPTIIALILAGKVGSSISSELGSMRISEQIDALDIMGIKSATYLVLPKIIAGLFVIPLILTLSIFLGISGGWIASYVTGVLNPSYYVAGIQDLFIPFHVTYAYIKSFFFAFCFTSIPAYHGYHVQGGALEVGSAGTQAVVYSSIAILIINYLLTQILLIS